MTTNAVVQSRTHNKQNEIGSATGQTTPTYDANGNQKKDFANRDFTYDAWNRTITASTRTYEIDGLGRRIQETVAGVTILSPALLINTWGNPGYWIGGAVLEWIEDQVL